MKLSLILSIITISFLGCTTVTSNKLPNMQRVDSTEWLERGIVLEDGTEGYFYTTEEKNYIKSELYRLGYSANKCIDIVNKYNEQQNIKWWEFWK